MTARLQIELGIDTRVPDSDAHRDAANNHTIVFAAHHDVADAETIISDVRSDITNIRTTASDIHRTKLKSRRGADGQDQVVSTTRTLSPSKYLPLLRLTLGQRSRLRLNPVVNIHIQRTRRVTASAAGKYAWNHSPRSSRRRFRGPPRRCEHRNRGLRHSSHAEKSARGRRPTSVGECHPYSVPR